MRLAVSTVGAGLFWLAVSGVVTPIQASAASGQEIFQKYCQACHGQDGKGNAALAKALQTEIPDLTTLAVAGKPETALLSTIADGKGKMPPFGKTLSQEEQRTVVDFLLKRLATGAR
jgi:mono/diheme cytochrome c family protein